jgi:hypothetical protein
MIRRCDDRDFELIWTIINDGAQAYKGAIPADRWTEPYMSWEKLHDEIDDPDPSIIWSQGATTAIQRCVGCDVLGFSPEIQARLFFTCEVSSH